MPVTARLSKRFYDVLGEDVANELVEWFNMVDATYRGDLRELNELNFARFDAKVEQRFAVAEADRERRFAMMQVQMDRRFAELTVLIEEKHQTRLRWLLLCWLTTGGGLLLLKVL